MEKDEGRLKDAQGKMLTTMQTRIQRDREAQLNHRK